MSMRIPYIWSVDGEGDRGIVIKSRIDVVKCAHIISTLYVERPCTQAQKG